MASRVEIEWLHKREIMRGFVRLAAAVMALMPRCWLALTFRYLSFRAWPRSLTLPSAPLSIASPTSPAVKANGPA